MKQTIVSQKEYEHGHERKFKWKCKWNGNNKKGQTIKLLYGLTSLSRGRWWSIIRFYLDSIFIFCLRFIITCRSLFITQESLRVNLFTAIVVPALTQKQAIEWFLKKNPWIFFVIIFIALNWSEEKQNIAINLFFLTTILQWWDRDMNPCDLFHTVGVLVRHRSLTKRIFTLQ